jgi:hypothetical protein
VSVPRATVPAPGRTPAGYGLLAAATVLPMGSERELMGVQMEVPGCGPSLPWPAACNATAGKPTHGGPDVVTGDPFAVMDSFECYTRDDAVSLATTRLALGAGYAVEQALWQGIAGQALHPNFSDEAVVLTTTALEAEEALAVLQQQLAVSAMAGGVIHLPRSGLSCLGCACVTRQGAVLRDGLGNAVAAGGGYAPGPASMGGTALPAGAGWWMVATGPVTVRRGPVIASPPSGTAFDVRSNMVLVVAEQVHVTTIECGAWAVPVTGCADLSVVQAPATLTPAAPQVVFGADTGGVWGDR